MSIRHAVIVLGLLPWAVSAYAHGIAGNRFFAGTITFDDPAVADEAILPGFSSLDHPASGWKRYRQSVRLVLCPAAYANCDEEPKSCARKPVAFPPYRLIGTMASAAICHVTATYAKPGFKVAIVPPVRRLSKLNSTSGTN